MKTQILILILFFPMLGLAQLPERSEFYKITAKSGLNVRENPTLQSKKLFAIPYGEKIASNFDTCYECEEDIIEGIKGMWVEVLYKGTYGYVFDGFLEHVPKIKFHFPEEYNSIYKNPISKRFEKWFGIYDVGKSNNLYKVIEFEEKKPAEENHVIDNIKKLEKIDPPSFIISGVPLQHNGNIKGWRLESSFYCLGKLLDPGEKIKYKNCQLYATGKLTPHPHPRVSGNINNYKLIFKQQMEDGSYLEEVILETSFTKEDLTLNGVFIRWLGDLDGDNKTDVILSAKNHHAYWDVYLFLSKNAGKGKLLREAASYSFSGC